MIAICLVIGPNFSLYPGSVCALVCGTLGPEPLDAGASLKTPAPTQTSESTVSQEPASASTKHQQSHSEKIK